MTKKQALKKYGSKVVKMARDMYETDFGKVLFVEDCQGENDFPATEEDQLERLNRARIILSK